MNNKKVGIIGANGFVGRAMQILFPDAILYDISLNGTKLEDIDSCDVAFLSVPTNLKDGKLDISIVEEIVSKTLCPLIIIRSTLNPGTADYLEKKYNKNIVVNPEYLGETVNHPLLNEKSRPFLVIGGKPENRHKAIELYQTVYNANITIRQVTNYEAEVIKLSENRAIAFKVMQCQELYDICKKADLDYNTIREAVYSDDPRFNLWFTFVYENNRGFNSSKCLKKDVPAFYAWAESVGYDAKLTKALIDKSNEYEKIN
jgi:UDPglucose 6-dehydrogenase